MSDFALPSGWAQRAARVLLSRARGSYSPQPARCSWEHPPSVKIPAVGAKAPDFTLLTPTGKTVTLSTEQSGHDLVLVILRGFPGYQCPYCVNQVHDFADQPQTSKRRPRECFWSTQDRLPIWINMRRSFLKSRPSCHPMLFS
jgi:AhpC/TSA family